MILQLEQICKEYIQGSMRVSVLKNITFFMEEGEYVAVMGPSGSGKTTLMNIIGCLDRPHRAPIVWTAKISKHASEAQMADIRLRKIGFVFQNFNLLPRQNALENVELPLTYAKIPKKERRQRAEEALCRVGLKDRIRFSAEPAFRRTETESGHSQSSGQPSETAFGR